MGKRTILTTAIPGMETPWDNGKQAYSGEKVEEFIKAQIQSKADGTDFTELEGRVATAEGKIETLNTGAGQLRDDIGGIEAAASALATRVTTAEGMINTAEGKITTAEGKINTLEAQVDTIQQTSIPNLAGRVSTIEDSTIPALALAVSGLDASKADKGDFVVMSESAYDGLEVKDAEKFYFVYEE